MKDSPLRLSELGEKTAEELQAWDWAKRTAELLRDRAGGKRPDQIQKLAFDFVYQEYQPDSEFDAAISMVAYDHGIDDTEVLDVLVVVLRDALIGLERPDG